MKRLTFRTAWLWAVALASTVALTTPTFADIDVDMSGKTLTITGTTEDGQDIKVKYLRSRSSA